MNQTILDMRPQAREKTRFTFVAAFFALILFATASGVYPGGWEQGEAVDPKPWIETKFERYLGTDSVAVKEH